MEQSRICPEIHYRRSNQGILLTACFGTDGNVVLPDDIDGIPVTAIAPYAFSHSELDVKDEVWKSETAGFLKESHRIVAEEVTQIRLPEEMTDIGRYAFYRCRNLKKMIFSDGILEIGGGAFNGCQLSELEIYCNRGRKSALKSVLDEIRFQIHARIYYRCQDGRQEIADILFPEHYEEAVENTPARILYTSHHGAGGYYRQCFFDRELDYKKYDELFVRAVTEENEDTILGLALGRLQYPVGLSEAAQQEYERYVKAHIGKAVLYCIANDSKDKLKFLAEQRYSTKESVEAGIDYAGTLKKTELVSMLMEQKFRYFPKEEKKFEL